ncbi:RlpA-like double-psi beta-barrel-protein domain-containing protein-containing protein [Desarmillaria tabescens]|uniref:RlpA-like double-psi beta-barrel-protein domain-containing protein-containing protein n=1 Tax=Armillaria tabescens TaxID=1929756 RepID=A0AA39KGR2_ARMTA|nr:RlpA-like double-psi beta-barrel-protein domain-containing protein-containing protein [Desarmillaria tabescens]KAK0459581.1 RlpA-like double-psi beta-barrel-protein domain-containing protein-containing protein [Desarmillaria tabescens]
MFFHIPIVTLALSLAALAVPHDNNIHAHRHNGVAKRARGDLNNFVKRYDNARWTFYDVGLGACGSTSVSSDYIVALNSEQYGSGYPGPYCFQTITMTYNGKTTTATIMDECPGCPYGGLDLSRGLFDFFADESAGVLYGTWTFSSGGSGAASSSSSTYVYTPTTTSTTPQWTPSTTSSSSQWTPTTTSSTWTPPTTSTSSTWSSSSTSSSSTWSAPTTSSSSTWSSSSSSSSAWSSSSSFDSSSASASSASIVVGVIQ